MTSIDHEPIRERDAASPSRPKLVFFVSETSGKSRRTEAFLAQVLQRRGNHTTFHLVRVDADRRPDLARRFRIITIPTLLVLEAGRLRGRG